MPIINVDWTEQTTAEKKKHFIDTIVNCVANSIKVSPEAINVLFREIPRESVRFPEAVFTITWSSDEKRNQTAKNKIISELTEEVLRLTNISPERIVFFFHDLPGGNVGVAGKPRL